MAQKRIMYQGDLKPDFSTLLEDVELDKDGEEVSRTPVADLGVADEVRLIGVITAPGQQQAPLFDREVSTVDGDGNVTMEWEDGDTDTVGLIQTEVEVMWPGQKPQTYRTAELIRILPDLGGTA